MAGILIDISRLFYRRLQGRLPTGIDRVSLEYVRHYGNAARAALSYGPFSSQLSKADSQLAFRALLDPDPAVRPPAARLVGKAFLSWWAPRPLRGAILFNTGHFGLENRFHGGDLRRRGARAVYMIHDLIPITHPQYCRPGERERHERRMRCAIRTGAGLIVPSRDTQVALGRFAEYAGLELPPTVVAPLAAELPRPAPGSRPLPEPYFVVLGTIEPRKNHALLLRIWRDLAARLGEKAPRLVIIGFRGWNNEAVFEQLDNLGPLHGRVLEYGSCNDEALVNWLRHARALLFPSFTEGYGLPLAEALALGAPVIASDLPVFREIADEIPDYASPDDDRRWTELIVEYSSDSGAWRDAQLARMRAFRPMTWKEHFEIVDAFLASLPPASQATADKNEKTN